MINIFALIFLYFFSPTPVLSQNDCHEKITLGWNKFLTYQKSSALDRARPDSALSYAKQVLTNKSCFLKDRIDAYELSAEAFLSKREADSAQKQIEMMLNLQRSYEPDTLASYKNLSEGYKILVRNIKASLQPQRPVELSCFFYLGIGNTHAWNLPKEIRNKAFLVENFCGGLELLAFQQKLGVFVAGSYKTVPLKITANQSSDFHIRSFSAGGRYYLGHPHSGWPAYLSVLAGFSQLRLKKTAALLEGTDSKKSSFDFSLGMGLRRRLASPIYLFLETRGHYMFRKAPAPIGEALKYHTVFVGLAFKP